MTKNMTTGSPAKLIVMFTIPLVIGNVFQQLYVVADTLIVGRTIGVNALAAVGSTNGIIFLLMGFIIGMTAGFSIITGQRFGAGDREGVRRSTAACIALSMFSTAVMTIAGIFGSRYALELMRTPPEIIEDAHTFIVIFLSGTVGMVMFNLLSNIIRALGDSRTPLLFLIFGSIVNVMLELTLIIGFGMGVDGAALSTAIAQLLAGILCIFYIKRRLPIMHVRLTDFKLTKHELWAHIRLGVPMGFQASIIAIGAIIIQVALNELGPDAIAAYSAAQKVDMIAGMPMMSFGMAIAAYSAQNYGAGKLDRIKKGVKQCIVMSVSLSIIVGMINISCGSWMVQQFVGDDAAEVVAMAQQYLSINAVCYWVLAMLFIYRYALQGLGKSFVPTIAGVMELIMRTFAAIFMAQWFGFVGVCTASPLAWIGSCVPLGIAYYLTMRNVDTIKSR